MSAPIPQPLADTITAEWDRLSSAGTWWRGEERVAIAREGRSARSGEPSQGSILPDIAVKAVRKIVTSAHEIDEAWVTGCHDEGLEPLPMVELLAVTAKISTIDTFLLGVGQEQRPLPQPGGGEPSRETVNGAEINHGWLPTRGPAGAPNCFSAVSMENDALHEFHASFYISMTDMRDVKLVKDLHRSQIELLAARTSFINDCFYWLMAHSSMLRASCKASDIDIDMRVVVNPSHHCAVDHYAELIAFTDALVQGETNDLEEARERLRAVAGDAGVVRAAAIVGTFQMMNQALDTLGATLGKVMPPQIRGIAEEFGVDPPAHWA